MGKTFLLHIENGVTIASKRARFQHQNIFAGRSYQGLAGLGARTAFVRERVCKGTPPPGMMSGIKTRKPVLEA